MKRPSDKKLRAALVKALSYAYIEQLIDQKTLGQILERWDELSGQVSGNGVSPELVTRRRPARPQKTL